MKRWGLILLALLVTVMAAHAASQSGAQTILQTPLNNAPYSDAAPVAQLPAGTNLTILERQGGWYHVRLDNGQDGWLQMTSIRMNGGGNTSNSGSGWGFGWLASLFESGRSGATGVTATTGVRGLNSGDIANAKPDPQATNEISAWAATPQQARQFAQQLGLKSEQVSYLPQTSGAQP
ncbi:MAG: SH3 domain-containing protein [Gammaproteobacteria bacterium]|nr:SH3 domain-containing protein [Gammaproteobacteria bacterium]